MSSLPSIWLLDAARRQLEVLQATPSIAWMVGWRSTRRIEILNICMFLSSDGEILRTTDTPYSIPEEMKILRSALPEGVEVLGCVVVYDTSIPMSVKTLFRSVVTVSSQAVREFSSSQLNLAGVWCLGEITLLLNGKGQDFHNLSEQDSEFLSRHLHVRWKLETIAPVMVHKEGQQESLMDTLMDRYADLGGLLFQLQDSKTQQKFYLSAGDDCLLMDKLPVDHGCKMDCSVYFSPKNQTAQCPVLHLQKIPQVVHAEIKNIALQLQIHSIIPLEISISKLFSGFLESALTQHLSHCSSNSQEFCSLAVDVDGYVFPVMVYYPFLPNLTHDESSHLEFRRCLQRRFLQKENHPVFKASSSLKPSLPSTYRLLNIHTHLPEKKFVDGMVGMVKGNYEYCHYGQNKIDDIGWGCAYRSCQTVFSWFLHQNYTQIEIPSHKKIQEVLVEVGDKQPAFYGSKEWIGSIEVGTVLNELLGVEYQVVSKAAHQDVATIARQLVHHFQIEGTPVSIGGGVLAYTLLGIYFNDETGKVELLILDPHYTGQDEIPPILKGGWIKWRTPEDKAAAGGPLFVKNTYYNFMCPKRPTII